MPAMKEFCFKICKNYYYITLAINLLTIVSLTETITFTIDHHIYNISCICQLLSQIFLTSSNQIGMLVVATEENVKKSCELSPACLDTCTKIHVMFIETSFALSAILINSQNRKDLVFYWT